MDHVVGEVKDPLILCEEWDVGLQNPGDEFYGGLDRPLGPAVLLALSGGHLDRDLGRADDLRQKFHPPPLELGPIAQIQILREGVRVPPTRVVDGLPPPDPRGAIEVHEEPRPTPGSLLHPEVAVDPKALGQGEKGVISIDVAPTDLDHGHGGILEEGERLGEEVRVGHEVGVEDGNELSSGDLKPLL